jgi:protein TonB
MPFPTDHIVSFALSAAVHLLGLLFLGGYAARPKDGASATVPELEVTSVELTLSEAETEAPGGGPAEASPAPFEPVAVPPDTPLEPLAPPAPVPLPEPPPPTPVAEHEPLPAPPLPPPPLTQMSSEIAIHEPAARPPPPEFALPEPSARPSVSAPPAPAAGGGDAAAPHPAVESGSGSGAGGAAGHIDGHPSLERTIRPVYPLGSRRRGEEGTVVLDVTVGPDGRASRVALVTSSGFPELDSAAERAAAQARFKPGKRNGRAVEASARLTLVFRLRDQ